MNKSVNSPSVRGGHISSRGNADGAGGKSSGSLSSETLVKKGVTQATPITEKPYDLGMDTLGASEKPMGIYKGSLSTDRGKFRCK